MASDYGLVGFIKAPVIKKLTQPSLIQFETEYSKYVRKVDDVNSNRPDDDQIEVASIRDCMDGKLLHALCIMGEIEGADTVEQATPQMVKVWFDNQIATSPRDMVSRIKAAVASVKYRQCPEDPSGAALTFCADLVMALDKHNVSDIIQDVEKAKTLIDMLENKIEPALLRKRLKDARSFWSKEEKGQLKFFKTNLAKLAAEVQQNEDARASLNKKDLTRKRSNKLDPDARESTKNSPAGSGSTEKHRKKRKGVWTQKCLNPKCDKIERIMDCAITPEDEKKRLLAEHYEKVKKSKSAKKVKEVVADNSEGEPDAEEGRYRVLFDDVVETQALGDYGSDFSAMSSKTFEIIQNNVSDVSFETFSEPMKLKGAFETDETISYSASRSTKLPITIILPGSNIPVRIRGIEFLITDQDMEEVLLGRPFLKSIGFDLTKHLVTVRDDVHDKDINELPKVSSKLATAKYSGMAYQSADDDPIHLPEPLAAGIGEDSNESIEKAFEKIRKDAKANGISNQGMERINRILQEYRHIFRIKLGSDPPAKVEPLKITLSSNARPFRSPQRRYAPQQRVFIINTVKELEKVGAIYKNPKARWASPALAVPKPGSDKLRFTVDLRGPNSRTVPIQSAMPHLESHLQDISGSTCFANIDLAHGYWQVPLAKESQEIMSIQTPIGVYSSRRILQGGTDAGNHFQAMLQEKFAEHVTKMLQWIDDFLFYASDESELLDNLESFCKVCSETGVKLHAEKCNLFAKKVKFCGRIISKDGVQFHPRHFQSLLDMKKPTKANELQQLLCATNWMRNSIPSYSIVVEPLHNLLEKTISKGGGKRTKQALRKFDITNEWGTKHDDAFVTIKRQLAASVKLSYPKANHSMCLFTDASDTHWAAILSQVPHTERRKPIEEQSHEPLCFLSGAFKGSSANWSVPEKEGFAIVEAMCRLDYLVTGNVVSIFTDHANLVYIYDPYGRNPGIPRHTASKLMRWAIKLSGFRYVVEHLSGDRNVWADMLTRWAVKPNNTLSSKRVAIFKSLMFAPINPGIDKKLDWPSISEVIESQKKSKLIPTKRFKQTSKGFTDSNGITWIPHDDRLMKLRIIIASHTGLGGHRGAKVTSAAIKSQFHWLKMDEDVKDFVESCIHCLSTTSGDIIPRPLGHALHASAPNKLLHFDFCYMSQGEEDYLYVLVLKDDFSGYVWLEPTKAADADTVTDVLIRWFSSFGVVKNWVSDRGSHFRNELVKNLKERLNSSHHFTLAYCPWSNGTVEVVCRELLRATRALLSEFQLSQKSWPSVIPIVQSSLNNSVLSRLGNRCPLTVFTQLPSDSPVTTIKHTTEDVTKVYSIDAVRASQLSNVEVMHRTLEEMHKDVTNRSTKKREEAVKRHNKNTGVKPVNFSEGDYVLKGLLRRQRGRKPSLRWNGPYRVVEVKSDYIFVIEDLLSGEKEEAHGRRLKFFRNKDFEVTEELKDYLSYQNGELLVIERFEDIRRNKGKAELLIKWKGFSDEENDWVSIETLREDVPTLLEDFLSDIRSNGTQRQRNIVSSL